MYVEHIEYIPKLVLTSVQLGPQGHPSVFNVGHSQCDPDWQSLLNSWGRIRLIGLEQIGGRVEVKSKEVCVCLCMCSVY